jgi:SAM-dependent methyltransferase
MNLFRRLGFIFRYLRRPPWDSGIVPPEVADFIRENLPGRALDLGCGTGTSSLALARAGWTVVGVDFVPGAIKNAKQKAKNEGLAVDFRVADITHLPSQLLSINHTLVLDIGCFHGLSPSEKTTYLEQLSHLLAPGGTWMMYGFIKAEGVTGAGLVESDLASAQERLNLIKRLDGVDKKGRPSMWVWFKG